MPARLVDWSMAEEANIKRAGHMYRDMLDDEDSAHMVERVRSYIDTMGVRGALIRTILQLRYLAIPDEVIAELLRITALPPEDVIDRFEAFAITEKG